MASATESPVETQIAEVVKEPQNLDDGHLKRKASPEATGHAESPKRVRRDDDVDHEDGEAAATHEPQSPQSARKGNENPSERRQNATQEEKKRSRRLFGGLLNTLSQAPSDSQQKRRQEIEKRQQERLKRQHAEDGKKRAGRLTELRKVRMAEQIVFDEEVMKKRHEKMLRLARFLHTRARPQIYYLPWKCTERQEEIIDDQIRKAKLSIAREKDDFERRRGRHIARHGPSQRARPQSPRQQPVMEHAAAAEASLEPMPVDKDIKTLKASIDNEKNGIESRAAEPAHVHGHEDAGDVMEEGEEDTVIY